LKTILNLQVEHKDSNYKYGRAFEYRKARKLKRWGSMAVTFTKLGKGNRYLREGVAGPDPVSNSRLRV
jgi:hypothetical protein